MIVLDTNVVSELMRASPQPRVLDWLDRQDDLGVFVSAVSEAEIRTSIALLTGWRRRYLDGGIRTWSPSGPMVGGASRFHPVRRTHATGGRCTSDLEVPGTRTLIIPR